MSATDALTTHKAIVENFCQTFYNIKDFDRAALMLADDFVNHHPGAGVGPARTVKSFQNHIADHFPEFSLEIRQVIAEADYVWTYGLIRLTPAARAAVSVDIWRIEDGRLAEHWDVGQQITEDTVEDSIL